MNNLFKWVLDRGFLILTPVFFLLGYLYSIIPNLSGIPLCGIKFLLHIDCPGCGLTTSVAALSHGHLMQSINAHPMGVVISAWFIYMFVRSAYIAIVRRPLARLLSPLGAEIVMHAFVVALIIQWVVKLVLHMGGHLTLSTL